MSSVELRDQNELKLVKKRIYNYLNHHRCRGGEFYGRNEDCDRRG